MSQFPNATPIYTYPPYSSTRLFNCHGYAWLRVEGGPDRWIGLSYGNRDPDIYMTDRSYVAVPNAMYPGKVFYDRPGDHSAVTTANNSNIVISKWNKWPLMQHTLGYGPYFGSSSWKFYVKAPVISGSTPICCNSTQSFSASNWQSGYYWDKSNNLVSISNPNNSTTNISVPNSNVSGEVKISVKESGGTTLAFYNLWVGPPVLVEENYEEKINGPGYVYYIPYATYYAYASSTFANTSYYWSSYDEPYVSFYPQGGSTTTATFNFSQDWDGYINIAATNICGGDYGSKHVYFSRSRGGGDSRIYPNPVSDILNVEIDQAMINKVKALQQNSGKNLNVDPVFDIRFFNGYGLLLRQQSTKGGTVQFNVSDLPNGLYFLYINDGVSGKPERVPVIVKH